MQTNISEYYYGNPPPSSVSGPNSGECKEGQDHPCYNAGCDNCLKQFMQQEGLWTLPEIRILNDDSPPEA
jgi:hypothetical protein